MGICACTHACVHAGGGGGGGGSGCAHVWVGGWMHACGGGGCAHVYVRVGGWMRACVCKNGLITQQQRSNHYQPVQLFQLNKKYKI